EMGEIVSGSRRWPAAEVRVGFGSRNMVANDVRGQRGRVGRVEKQDDADAGFLDDDETGPQRSRSADPRSRDTHAIGPLVVSDDGNAGHVVSVGAVEVFPRDPLEPPTFRGRHRATLKRDQTPTGYEEQRSPRRAVGVDLEFHAAPCGQVCGCLAILPGYEQG